VLSAAIAAMAPRGASASPQEVLGFGYRSIAMGTTGAAIGEGVDTVYANPALLSASRDLTLQVGTLGAVFDLQAEGAGLGALPGYTPLTASTIGGLLPLPFGGILEDRITIGLGFLTPYQVVVRGRILYPERPQYLLADRVQSVAVQAAIGLDLGYGIRLGGGFAALAALTGSVLVQTDASGRIGTVVEDTLVASYAPIVGASYDLGEDWRIGLSFRGELVGRFNVVIEAENLGQIEIPPLNISGVPQYDPWQIALEGAYLAGPLRAALGLSYKHWPAYPGPLEATVRCEDAPDPGTSCEALVPLDPNYAPVVAPRLGIEYSLPLSPEVELDLRAGYAFEPSPAPEQVAASNYYDNHRSLVSLGYGVDLSEGVLPVAFDGFAQVQWLHDRSHDKSTAAGAPVDATVDTRGLILGGGASASVMF
jgi:long-chain fatty acid transport protein